MLLEQFIKPDSVLCNAQAHSKKQCLEILSELLVHSNPDIANESIFENIIERERLGCTGLGRGVAFPHCRVDGLNHCEAALIKLNEPIDYEAEDGDPVDLVFAMMVPEQASDAQVTEIRAIAEVLKDEGLRARLRTAKSSSELYAALIDGASIASPAPD